MRTAVFDTISALRPFFFSLRELYMSDPNGGKVSLDIRIPISWQSDSILESMNRSDVVLKVQDKNEHNKLVSVISSATKEGYDDVFTVAKKIIKANQEEEEKIKLFNDKVEELKTLFLNSSLDKLKDISFKPGKNGLRNTESIGKTELGDSEGSGTDGEN